jgi:hypothetical protein
MVVAVDDRKRAIQHSQIGSIGGNRGRDDEVARVERSSSGDESPDGKT